MSNGRRTRRSLQPVRVLQHRARWAGCDSTSSIEGCCSTLEAELRVLTHNHIAGQVKFRWWPAADGPRILEDARAATPGVPELSAEAKSLLDYLAEHPKGWLVVAECDQFVAAMNERRTRMVTVSAEGVEL